MASISSGGGAAFLDFLQVIKDPAAYEQKTKELLDREASANEAQLRLEADQKRHAESIKDYTKDRDQLDKDISDFQTDKRRILEKEQTFDARQADLDKREAAVKQSEEQVSQRDKANLDWLQQKQGELDARESAVGVKEKDLAERESVLTAKENSVADKLSKLKGIIDG